MEAKSFPIQFDIPNDIFTKWEKTVTIIAKLLNVPAALIMRIVEEDITVFLSSDSENNPYIPGERHPLKNSGLYCEHVLKTKNMLLVPNALSDEDWKNNPDVKLNMISYLGFPISLPDNKPFGTICVLDVKENEYSDLHKELLEAFRDTLERDILLLYNNHHLKEKNEKINSLLSEKETLLKEVHHRIKNNIASIEGLLLMQAETTENLEVKNALKVAASRVQGVRVLYDKLLATNDYEDISVKDYIESLLQSVMEVFPKDNRVKIESNIHDFTLNSKVIIPIGIIINELLTNIFKYAFEGRNDNKIKIEMLKKDSHLKLTIQDNGIGIGIQPREPGFGLTIVKMLVEQLSGTYSMENDNGTKTVLTFAL